MAARPDRPLLIGPSGFLTLAGWVAYMVAPFLPKDAGKASVITEAWGARARARPSSARRPSPPRRRLHRKQLAIALSRIPDHPRPDTTAEQVRTPGTLAADILLLVAEEGDLEGKRVLDLGAGTGVFTVGAALLGAGRVLAVEKDAEALALARQAAITAHVEDITRFLEGDVREVAPRVLEDAADLPHREPWAFDTVLMNPPFGADLVSRSEGGDRVFLDLAFRVAEAVYSLHLARTESFLSAFARDNGRAAERITIVPFPVPARFAHHREEVRQVDVGVYRFLPV